MPYAQPPVAVSSIEAAQTVTPGASPFTWTNSLGYPVNVIVAGGTVTLIEWIVAGAAWSVGLLTGVLELRSGDGIRVTYTLAPAMRTVRS